MNIIADKIKNIRNIKPTDIWAALRSKTAFYACLLIAMLIKHFPFGLKYFKYLDDTNQYGVFYYYLHNKPMPDYKLYTMRPMAALTDLYIIAPFWNHMWVILLFITILHFITIILLDKIFSYCNIAWGKAAALCFGLYPLLTESTYWISASSRLVVGLFFVVLSAYLILKFIHSGHNAVRDKICLAAGILTGIIAQGFYEQLISFSFAFMIIILVANRRAVSGKLKFVYALPFMNLSIIGAYYLVFRNSGVLGNRSQISDMSFIEQIQDIFSKIYNVFNKESAYTIDYTLSTGIFENFKEHPLLSIAVTGISLLLAANLFLGKNNHPVYTETRREYNALSAIFIAASFLSPFGPFFLLKDSYIYIRNIFISVMAFAALTQFIWNFVSKYKASKIIFSVAASAAIFVFMFANICDVNSYRIVEKYDNHISQQLCDQVAASGIEYRKIWLFNVRYTYEPLSSARFSNSMLNDWSATAQLITKLDIGDTKGSSYVNPVLIGREYNLDIDETLDGLFAIDAEYNVRPVYLSHWDGYVKFADNDQIAGTVALGENGKFLPD